ncbi:MAG: hypothetical protein LC101_02210 [Flavobacteriales bacterium]|nr:hypothetical protein [Flavobacteriales bacterium]
MKWILRYRELSTAIALLMAQLFVGCGSQHSTEAIKPELDSINYASYIAVGPDTAIYPIHQTTSSQREPIDEYGLQNLFDQNDKTGWFSEPGLHAGEWIEFKFDRLPVSRLQIVALDSFIVARVQEVEITVNDSVLGIFPIQAFISIHTPISKLRIKAVDADGLNIVNPPLTQDTTSTIRTAYLTYASHYNSRSFAIAELRLFDEKGKLLPIKAIPNRTAKINLWSQTDSRLITDGNTKTGFAEENEVDHRINFAFEVFTPITRIAVWNGIDRKPESGYIQKAILSIAGHPEASFILKPGYNEYVLPFPMVSRLFTLRLLSTKKMAFSELRFYDGARYYIPYPDSAGIKTHIRLDSLQNTDLSPVLNHRIYVKERKVILNSDTIRRSDYRDLPINMLNGAETNEYQAVFRANGTFEIERNLMLETYGKAIQISQSRFLLTGYWTQIQKTSDGHVVLYVNADILISNNANSVISHRQLYNQSLLFRSNGEFLSLDNYGILRLTY